MKGNNNILDEPNQKLFEVINDFRKNPQNYLDNKKCLKKRNHAEYENFLKSLEQMNEFKIDEELTNIAKSEVKKFSEDSEYNKFQLGEELAIDLGEKFIKENSALIAIEDIDEDTLIPKIICNEGDKDKKGRNFLTSNTYTHIGLHKLENDDGCFLILIFSQIDESKIQKEKEVIEVKKEYTPTEEEKQILDMLNEFRKNPKDFLEKKKFIKKKHQNEYETYINSLKEMNEFKINEELINICKEQVQKLTEDPIYKKYQIGEEINLELSDIFIKEYTALIALEDIDIESLIPKIIINNVDKKKMGRVILTNNEYTHIGFHKLENDEGTSLVLIFSKVDETKIKNVPEITKIVKKEYIPTEEEKPIFDLVNEFRSNPKSFADKKDGIKKKEHKEYERYINTLEKMEQLKIDEELINIAKEEVKQFSEDSEYTKYQIGEEIKHELSENFDKEHSALIALEDINNDNFITKIIVNDSDKEKKGREILTNNIYTHIGFNKIKNDDGIFMVIIFSTEKGK